MSPQHPLYHDEDTVAARMRMGRVLFETPDHLQGIRQGLSKGDVERFRSEAQELRRLSEESGDLTLVRLCSDLEGGDPLAQGAADLVSEIEGRFVALWEDVGRGIQDD